MSQQQETERVRELFEASAASYDRAMAFNEKLLFGDGRAWACSQARGQVLEIAIGTGRNLPFYQADVEITGIEISPAMLEIARLRAQGPASPRAAQEWARRRSCRSCEPARRRETQRARGRRQHRAGLHR